MKTQVERIKASKQAYIVPINPNHSRFAIYIDDLGELDALCPSDSHNGKAFKDRLPYQSYTTREGMPAFHFALNGGGYSKSYELAEMLKQINPALKVSKLTPGWSPSNPS